MNPLMSLTTVSLPIFPLIVQNRTQISGFHPNWHSSWWEMYFGHEFSSHREAWQTQHQTIRQQLSTELQYVWRSWRVQIWKNWRKKREIQATASRRMDHMSRCAVCARTCGYIFYRRHQHVIALWQKIIPRVTFVDTCAFVCYPKKWYRKHERHLHTVNILFKTGPSFNWMQGSGTCVRKWDCDYDSPNLWSERKAAASPGNVWCMGLRWLCI